jgi:hypothetical protein
MCPTRCRTAHDPSSRKDCRRKCHSSARRGRFVEVIVLRLWSFVAMSTVLLVMLLLGADLGLASTTVVLLGSAASQMAAPGKAGGRRQLIPGR